jgi:UDP-N-acetylmuramoyl-tripeptide--D-alanyl-D-alanine ligase
MALDAIAAALGDARAVSPHRMQLLERSDGILVVDDAYNANPESMRAALDAIAAIGRGRPGRTFAVLGPMAELGPDAPGEHEAVGRAAAALGLARVIAVGEQARPIQHGAALEGSWIGDASWVPDVAAAIALLRDELRTGDAVLVKASRAAELDRVAAALADSGDDGADDADGNGGGTG